MPPVIDDYTEELIKQFAEGIIGYWTTSNDLLPTKEEAEYILNLMKTEKQGA